MTELLIGRSSAHLEDEAIKKALKWVNAESLPHPDITVVKPEGKLALHTAERLRDLTDEAIMPPFQSAKRVFIIIDAEKMWPVSANSLLKSLEEPVATTSFILTSCHKERILPTLISRCKVYAFAGEEEAPYANPELEKIIASRPYRDAILFFEDVRSLASQLDALRKGEDDIPKDLTAYQKERLEKEAEGARQMVFQEEFDKVLNRIAQLHILEFDKVIKLIQEAKLKRERSTSLHAILESFFIKLGYL